MAGKGTLELTGAHSPNFVANPEQEFYIQLSEPEVYGIIKLTTKGAVRIVENLTANAARSLANRVPVRQESNFVRSRANCS